MSIFSRWFGFGKKRLTYGEMAEILDGLALKAKLKVEWRPSVADLMYLLKLDNNLNNRIKLAKRLGYPGKADGSATMNIWLHGEIMQRLSENGGTVPDSLK